jgi:hypothetical protein
MRITASPAPLSRKGRGEQAKRGISLLEVLISMFVLAVGLLSLASMVPVGQFQVTQANHADAATAVGRKAFREIKVRDMLDEAAWITTTGAAYAAAPPKPFVIDSLAVISGSYANFPYGGASFPVTNLAKPDRISIKDLPLNVNLNQQSADRIFRGTDDRQWDLANDTTQRPKALLDSTSTPLPIQQQSRGEYSWLAMVSPLTHYTLNGTQYQSNYFSELARVDVVVFHKRDLVDTSVPTSERSVWADVQFSGFGTLDVQLRIPDPPPTPVPTDKEAKELLRVRVNQWVMISGERKGKAATTGPPPTPALPAIPVHRWFRVVSVGEMQSTASPWIIDVTLAGPELEYFGSGTPPPALYTDADDSTPATSDGTNTLICTICDGVVAVFEKTVQLDEPSLWTAH